MKQFYLFFLALMTFGVGVGQVTIPANNTDYNTDFNGWNGTLPTGFAVSGATNSTTYRGTTESTTGGLYAIASNGFGHQASGSANNINLTGTFQNATGGAITSLTISYEAFNIVTRSSRTPGWTVTSSLGTVSGLNWTYNAANSSSNPAELSVTLTGLDIENNATFTITFRSDRGGGSGSSPLIGLNNINVRSNLSAAPSVTTGGASSITQTAAILEGNITSTGGVNPTVRGIEYSTTLGFTIGDGTIVSSTGSFGTGVYTEAVSGLTSGTTYYYRAFATNSVGTTHGAEESFTTSASATTPAVTTNAATTISNTGATLNGEVIADGGEPVTARGFVYSDTATTPEVGDGVSDNETSGSGVGVFDASISGLTPNTLYYVQAYATNTVGTTHGGVEQFVTVPNAPTVGAGSGATASSITANWTAPSPEGNQTYTYTVQISETSDFAIVVDEEVGIASSNTSFEFTGLTGGTDYFFRVRAVNATGPSAWSAASAAYSTTSIFLIYEFTGNTVAPAQSPSNATTSNFQVSANTIVFRSANPAEWSGSGVPYAQSSNGWTSATAEDAKYFFFTIEPELSYRISLTNVSFQFRRTNAGPQNITVEINGIEIGSDINIAANTVFIFNEALSGFTNLNSVEVRIKGWNGGNGDFRINDVRLDGEIIEAISYVYQDGSWSPSDPNGTSTLTENITIASGNADIVTNTDANSITINPGAGLTVDAGVTLTVAEAITLESVSDNYSSLILNGTINGTVNYNRYTNLAGSGTNGGNDLVSPPLSGQTFGDFAAANDGVLAASGDVRAFAPFNNTASAYQNYNVTSNSAITLASGKGYRAATIGGAPLTFSGNVETGTVNASITSETGIFGDWNLIGNPYPSYINIQDFLNHEVEGVSNINLMKDASGIYGYDGNASDGWDVITQANAPGRLMAPGQGFFVAADVAASLQFTPAMRVAGSGDDFIPGRTAPLTYLKLVASNGTNRYKTDIYFNANATAGLDPGYDAQIWGGQNSGFILYSHLVENNTGMPLALQALGMDALNNVSIPLGINATAGSNLEFSILESQLPTSTQVYLEDTVNSTITLINDSNANVNLNTNVNGTGRFFLRFTNNALSITDELAKRLNIYHQNTEQVIVIAGQLANNTQAYLYDLQGREVSTTFLRTSQTEQRMDVSNLSNGVYVLSFENGAERVSKKLIIR